MKFYENVIITTCKDILWQSEFCHNQKEANIHFEKKQFVSRTLSAAFNIYFY